MSKKVFLGVGHGGTDREQLRRALKKGPEPCGFKSGGRRIEAARCCTVLMSGQRMKTIRWQRKSKSAMRSGGLAVDIHNNAGRRRAEAYYHYRGGTSKTLAVNILDEITKIGQNSRGAKIRRKRAGERLFRIHPSDNCAGGASGMRIYRYKRRADHRHAG